jgi:hypothetical protein
VLKKKVMARTAAGAVSAGLVLALSGCVAQIVVDNAGGVGECDSVPVSISTSQNGLGDTLTVEYTGPEAISLFFVRGFYSETSFDGLMDTRLLGVADMVNFQDEEYSALVTKLDTAGSGWSQSGSANTTTYTFSGSIEELVDGQITLGGDMDQVIPGAVAINCDPSAVSETLVASPIVGDEFVGVVEDYNFVAAQPVYPNHVNIDPFVIVSQEPDGTGGVRGTLRLADSTAATFGSFVPVLLEENSAILAVDAPDVTNDSFGNLWFQLFTSSMDSKNSGSLVLTAPEPSESIIGQDLAFEWTGDGELPTGDFIAAIGLANADASEQKLVFLSLSYDPASGGLSVDSPLNPTPESPEPSETPVPTATVAALAATGTDGFTVIAAGVAALMVLAGTVLAATRRRKNAL